jgi:hypothetical protein
MKLWSALFRRGRTRYGEDTNTGKPFRLRTKDNGEALNSLDARQGSAVPGGRTT